MGEAHSSRFGSKIKTTALEARANAQRIAFGPFIYQVARSLRDLGILKFLVAQESAGVTPGTIATELGLSEYGVSVLLEGGLAADLVWLEDDKYFITKTGVCVLDDEMTRINMNFVGDVCYRAMTGLSESIVEGKPAGLPELGPWSTLYEGLTQLPEPAQTSWFEFDHFYSDTAFADALPIVFADSPRSLVDVGGNTGRWSARCLGYSDEVHVTLVDLPPQLALAQSNLSELGYDGRFTTCALDLLTATSGFPAGADVIWMSQFLDCFSEPEIIQILSLARASMGPNSSLYILETFWDDQRFAAAAFSLVNISLYFTCIANGNSKMYHSDRMKHCAAVAGLELVDTHERLGLAHTLLRYKLPA